MHTGIAQPVAASMIASGGRPEGASAPITENATIAPNITTSPCAKLMSWMMP